LARLFGIPPTSVGNTDKATYSNVERKSTVLVRNALAPLAGRVEAAISRCLLTEDQRRDGFYIEHELTGLLRGDTAARFTAYATGRQWVGSRPTTCVGLRTCRRSRMVMWTSAHSIWRL
jgi:phage portal protein BeeE